MKKTLNIKDFPKEVHASLKAKAAILQVPLRELIIETLRKSVAREMTGG